VIASKKNMDWPEEPAFLIPDDALALFREAVTEGKQAEAAWNDAFAAYQKAHPELAAALTQALNGELPSGWDADLPTWSVGDKAIATQGSEALPGLLPWILRYGVGDSI